MTLTLHALLHAVGLPVPRGVADAVVTSITSDSRCVSPGSVFVGLPGERVDGGSFWPRALADGAIAVLIGDQAAGVKPPGPDDAVIVVPDPVARWAGELAAAFWDQPSERLGLIGVTGTNGKTTTTHLIEHLSLASGRASALFGTLANRWPGHSVTATHTTAVADRLQSQLAKHVLQGPVNGHGGELPCPGSTSCGGMSLCRCGVHESDPGPSGLSRDDGVLLRSQGETVCSPSGG